MDFFGVGDSAICVEFGPKIDVALNQEVIRLALLLDRHPLPGQIEVVPAYSSLMIYYNPSVSNVLDMISGAKERVSRELDRTPTKSQVHEVPVCYGGVHGVDLEAIAALNGVSEEEVIRIHTNAEFRVFMLGFMPGFPYCGIVPEKIRAPRLSNPRMRVPAGSVGIAEAQTGIYPMESPGGWRLIGRTPLRLFDATVERNAMFRFAPGDVIRFRSISREEFDDRAN